MKTTKTNKETRPKECKENKTESDFFFLSNSIDNKHGRRARFVRRDGLFVQVGATSIVMFFTAISGVCLPDSARSFSVLFSVTIQPSIVASVIKPPL